jgi:hypothetical protein
METLKTLFTLAIDSYLLKSHSFGQQKMCERVLAQLQPFLGDSAWTAWNYLNNWKDLRFYSKITKEAYMKRPFAPQVPVMFTNSSRGITTNDMGKAYIKLSTGREHNEGSQYYGHDIVVKRYAGLPLVSKPLPLIIEHGLQFAPVSSYDSPGPWAKAWLCMGPGRAKYLVSQFSGLPAIPIGPMISYARDLIDQETIRKLRKELGPTLLVILAHGWENIRRDNPMDECIRLVKQIQAEQCYQSVLYLRHWADPECTDLPPSWHLVCNGHRLNPWFLDSLKTLFSLSDGMATNMVATHLGYALAMNKRLHLMSSEPSHEYPGISQDRLGRELVEQDTRRNIINQIRSILNQEASLGQPLTRSKLIDLLDPHWGFSSARSAEELRQIIRDLQHGNAVE